MTIVFPVPFTKMSGTGNDFIIIDHRTAIVPEDEQSQFVEKVCRRKFAAGADGLIFIEASEKADFSWRFFNADGSVAEMCGNGARCAARFAYKNNIAGRQMSFETLAGIIEAEIIGDAGDVRLKMTDPFDIKLELQLPLDDIQRKLMFANTGVPHAVLIAGAEEDVPVEEWGKEIRFHSMFQPEGANVNFVKLLPEGGLSCRTYERGVEAETMACGTGAVAAAIIAGLYGFAQSPVQITTSGGDQLTITFDCPGTRENPKVENVFLQGPARIIYEGELIDEALL